MIPELVRTRPTPSLVVTPAVVAHRGASGHRPELTLAAFRTAIRMGVDDIEVDVVPTRDGVLVARHESELSRTTDVADHPELAHLRTTKVVDGVEATGWFTEDLDLAEVKRLAARERFPDLREQNTAYTSEGVPTLNEVLAMAHAESVRRGRGVGVMVELKHPAHFAGLGLPLEVPLVADLARHGLDHARSRVTVMSFEPTVLRRIAGQVRVPILQLLDRADRCPPDLADGRTYGDLTSPEGLAWIDEYADGVGPSTAVLAERPRMLRDAHRHWLTVHAWTLRAENRFLPLRARVGTDPAAHGDLAGEVRALLDAGVDGLITDHPDVVLLARAEWLRAAQPGAQPSGSRIQASR